jgi:mRNA-degrading endonuclease toxin of MazEF toxin-antitoxin module
VIRGQVWTVGYPARRANSTPGQTGSYLALVVSADALNQVGVVHAAPLYAHEMPAAVARFTARIPPDEDVVGTVRVYRAAPLATDRFLRHVGTLSTTAMSRVDAALRAVYGL